MTIWRKVLGWLVAVGYALVGARRRSMRCYDKDGAVLSIFGHESRPDVLEPLVRYLVRRGFTFVSTDELLAMRAGKKVWRPRLAWLTYDDGWRGLLSLLPVLEKYNVPITVFISPRETDRRQAWANHIQSARCTGGSHTLFDLDACERYRLIDDHVGLELDKHELASWKEIQQVAQHPLVTIENHTNSHLSCSHRPIGEVQDEIRGARLRLAEMGLSQSRLMCYPFGHYTNETDLVILQSGMIPVRSDAGVMTLTLFGRYRNAFHQAASKQENIGRILCAWPHSRIKHR